MTLLLEHLGSRPSWSQPPLPLSPCTTATTKLMSTTICSNSSWIITPPPRAVTGDTARCPIVPLLVLL